MPTARRFAFLDRLAWGLGVSFAADRLLKLAAVEHAFRRPAPAPPAIWPDVALIQPITRGSGSLAACLAARTRLDYPAPICHLWVCDAADRESQAVCRAVLAERPDLRAQVVLIESDAGGVATKIRKLQAALPLAEAAVVVFMDDDVLPRPDLLRRLIPYLDTPRAGAVYGLPCQINWRTPWSSLLAAFANANHTLSFIALTYVSEPLRITGQAVAFRRAVFAAIGGLDGLEGYLDDDFVLAQRLRRHERRAVQTPVVYDLDDPLPDGRSYAQQLARWFVLPGQAMFPQLTLRQRLAATLASGPSLAAPGLLAVLGLAGRRRSAWLALAGCVGLFGAVAALTDARYLGRRAPVRRWPLMPIVAVVTPLHALGTMLGGTRIVWRGQRLRVHRDGRFEVVS